MKVGLLVALLASGSGGADLVSVVERARVAGLARDTYWHQLLHYRAENLGPVSDVDDPVFFLHRDGKRDPAAELEATLRGMYEPLSAGDRHVQCRFPARTLWLRDRLELNGTQPPRAPCPGLAGWLEDLDPGRLTLVFASAFLSSPPSMFGHTLLRVDRADHPNEVLLSTILNYAGRPNTDNPVLYAWRGLTGGFPGRFSTLPYYLKVQEYTDLDRRDLWEYELDLSPVQIERLILHAWELLGVDFEYFFVDENCSYQLLTLLDIADPSLRLADDFGITTIPTDTVRAVSQRPGLVRRRLFRPALTTAMASRHDLMTRSEAALAEQLVEAEAEDFTALKALDPARKALVLEAAHDYLKYRHPYGASQALDPARPKRDREHSLLQLRSEIDTPVVSLEVATPAAPDQGHGSSRVGLGLGVLEGGDLAVELNWRAGMHDLLDRTAGYVPDSEIEVADLWLRFSPSRLAEPDGWRDGIMIERLDLARVASITPKLGGLHSPSWRVALGGGRVVDLPCVGWECWAGDLSGSIGYALAANIWGRETLYGFADVQLAAGPAFEPAYRIGAGATIGLLLEPFDFLRLQAEVAYRYDFLGDTAAGPHLLVVRVASNLVFGRDLALRLVATQIREKRELRIIFLHYYD